MLRRSTAWKTNALGLALLKPSSGAVTAVVAATGDGCSLGSRRSKSEYLHRSIVPTDHFQKSLPRLPIPEIEKTCSRYLASQLAYLDDDSSYQNTLKLTEDFQKGIGKDLQEELKVYDRRNKHTSYVTDFWFDMYFKDRRPVVLNHNPFMSFKEPTNPAHKNQVVRTTNMLISSLKYCKTLRANILEPEVYHLDPKKSDTDRFRNFVRLLPKSVAFYGAYWYKAFPLDMSQFGNLFNSTRLPKTGKDELYKDESAKHVLVIRNGNFYIFDCFDRDGNILPANELMGNLKYIQQDDLSSHSIGYLSSQERNTWADARERLIKLGNAEQLKLIDTALFAICLDSDQPNDEIAAARQFLHGDAADRWYDKCFTLIVTPKGDACVNFEHSWGDGVAVMSYFNAVYKDSNENPAVENENTAVVENSVRKLEFNLDPTSKQDIDDAKERFTEAVSSLNLNYIKYEGLGKEDCKRKKLSPDSVLQFALQLAYKRCYGSTPATYESCSTSAFKHGRTETIRPSTTATNEACQIFDNSASSDECLAALSKCSAIHGELTKNAAMGQGWDRHLYAMRLLAEADKREVALFQDDAYKSINTITLSTSTLSSPSVHSGGFAPVVAHGLGVGYFVDNNFLGTVVTTYSPHKKPEDFLSCLEQSYNDLQRVLK